MKTASNGVSLQHSQSRVQSPGSLNKSDLGSVSVSNDSRFWTRFDAKLKIHVPSSCLRRYFGSISMEFESSKRSTFAGMYDDIILWQKDFDEWMPVRRKPTKTLSFYLDEISSRLYAGLYKVLRKDWFELILATEAKLTDVGYRLRAKGELEQAEADALFRESELFAIQKLVIRCAQEREEAEAAEVVLQRERAQFLQSHEALRVSREILEQARVEASQDGAIDLAEEEKLAKLRVEVRIAEARDLKERQEFEEAIRQLEKECRDRVEMETRLREREAAFRLAAEEARASNALLNGNPRQPLCSLVNRIYAYESTLPPPQPPSPPRRGSPRDQPAANGRGMQNQHGSKPGRRPRSLFHSISQEILGRLRLFLDDTSAVLAASDGSGYLGEVHGGRPHGHGVEWCRASQVPVNVVHVSYLHSNNCKRANCSAGQYARIGHIADSSALEIVKNSCLLCNRCSIQGNIGTTSDMAWVALPRQGLRSSSLGPGQTGLGLAEVSWATLRMRVLLFQSRVWSAERIACAVHGALCGRRAGKTCHCSLPLQRK